jgi:very-short-patch-repair endonuclease
MRSPSKTHTQAKALRRTLTPPEIALWALLRTRAKGAPTFRRQHPIGPYIADFYCAAARLVVEIDGWDHAAPERVTGDARRDRYMDELGYRVIRIAAAEVRASAGDVAQGIYDTARELIEQANAAKIP